MFYMPQDNDHGLPHNPFKAIVSPRPIAWVSSVDNNGVANLAPYSFFNAVADTPPMVMFGSIGAKPDQEGCKDTLANIKATGEFAINIVPLNMKDAMNATGATLPSETDEFTHAGLTRNPGKTIDVPHVAGVPAVLECKLFQLVTLPGAANTMVIGQVTGVHLDDQYIKDGLFDVTAYQPLARLGYMDYSAVDQVFSLQKPA